MANPRPFDETWTAQDTHAWVSAQQIAQAAPVDPKVTRHWDQTLEDCLIDHLRFLAAAGQLQAPEHSENVAGPWIEMWRTLCKHGTVDPHERHKLLGNMTGQLFRSLLAWRQGNTQTTDTEAFHHLLMGSVVGGTMAPGEYLQVICANSGQSLKIGIQGWQPAVFRYDHGLRQDVPLGAGDITPAVATTAALPVPCGNLLVSTKLLQHPAVAQAVRRTIEATDNTMSSRGCKDRSLAMADIGIGHVHVGNGTVVVHADKTTIMAHYVEPACDRPTSKPGRGTWVSIVDEKTLLDLLERHVGQRDAQTAVQQVRESDDTTRLSVPAGTHHLYFAGDSAAFGASFHTQFDTQTIQPLADNPIFSLLPTPLEVRLDIPTRGRHRP